MRHGRECLVERVVLIANCTRAVDVRRRPDRSGDRLERCEKLGNLGFWWLALHGRDALPGLVIPAFDWGFVKLAVATPVDGGLLMAIASENITSGMGTAAFVAFLMSLCNRRFSATQFALLSAFASVGRVWVGPLAGVLAQSIGWPAFFLASIVAALPALALLLVLRAPIDLLERDPATADDPG